MIPALFALLVSTAAPDGPTPPVTLGLFGSLAACEAARSGPLPVQSRYPVTLWCVQLL